MNASLVPPCQCLADVGCDHAYTLIYLAMTGKIGTGIAMDVVPGPLARAQESIARYGVSDKIGTRLSDGLKALAPGEAEVILFGGMGGPLMAQLLRDGIECVRAAKGLVLQPQSELREFRRELSRLSLAIVDEEMCCEGGKYYTAIYAEPVNEAASRQAGGRDRNGGYEGRHPGVECAGRAGEDSREYGGPSGETLLADRVYDEYGPRLIEKRHPVLREYVRREIKKREELLERLAGQNTGRSEARLRELAAERGELIKLLGLFEDT